MIKDLKLTKAVIAIVLGVVALIAAKIMEANNTPGMEVALAISGALFIIGSLIFLYPIIFAKKVDSNGNKVELKPLAKDHS